MGTLRWTTGFLMLACAEPRVPAAEGNSSQPLPRVVAAPSDTLAANAEPDARGEPNPEDGSWAPPEQTRAKLGVGQGFRCEIVMDTAACVATQLSFHCPEDQPPGPVLARVDSVVEIGAGERHACFVERSGQVLCAGLNEAGGLGDGTTNCRWTPQPVAGISGVTQLAVGHRQTCVLTTPGKVFCWGGMNHKPLITRPTAVAGLEDAVGVSAGFFEACAVRRDGSVWCWGAPSKPHRVAGLPKIQQVTVGSHVCALAVDRSVWCWGTNGNHQVGVGDDSHVAQPVKVPRLADVAQVAAGPYHTCARLVNGTVQCWGSVRSPRGTPQYAPKPIHGLSDANFLTAGYDGGCARVNDGSTWCFDTDLSVKRITPSTK